MSKNQKTKKQHYVPQFYLANFSDNSNQLSVLNYQSNTIIKNTSYKTHCYTKYMYGADQVWEKKLGVYETKWSTIFSQLIKQPNTILNAEEIESIKTFIAFQHMRTESAVTRTKDMYIDFTRQTIPIVAQFYGENIPKNQALSFASKYVAEKISHLDITMTNLEAVIKSVSVLDDLDIRVLKNVTEVDFVSSDNPIIYNNYFQSDYGLGYDCIGVWFLIPISPKIAVLLVDSKIYPQCKNTEVVLINDVEEVNNVNYLQYINSRMLLFSHNVSLLEEIKIKFDNLAEEIKPTLLADSIKKSIYDRCALLNPAFVAQEVSKVMQYLDISQIPLHPKNVAPVIEPKIKLLKLSQRAIPFMNTVNLNYWRHKTKKEMWERINSLKCGTNFTSKESDSCEMNKLDSFGKFLLDYFDDKLD